MRAEFLTGNAVGGFTPIAVSAAPIVGPDGAVLGAVAACEDITAPKELERLRAELELGGRPLGSLRTCPMTA